MKGTNRAIILTLLAGLAIPATNVIAEDMPISLEPWNSPNYIEDDDFPLGPLGPHYRVQCISDQIERVNNADARITNLYEEQQGIREKLQCFVDNLKYSEDAYSDTYPPFIAKAEAAEYESYKTDRRKTEEKRLSLHEERRDCEKWIESDKANLDSFLDPNDDMQLAVKEAYNAAKKNYPAVAKYFDKHDSADQIMRKAQENTDIFNLFVAYMDMTESSNDKSNTSYKENEKYVKEHIAVLDDYLDKNGLHTYTAMELLHYSMPAEYIFGKEVSEGVFNLNATGAGKCYLKLRTAHDELTRGINDLTDAIRDLEEQIKEIDSLIYSIDHPEEAIKALWFYAENWHETDPEFSNTKLNKRFRKAIFARERGFLPDSEYKRIKEDLENLERNIQETRDDEKEIVDKITKAKEKANREREILAEMRRLYLPEGIGLEAGKKYMTEAFNKIVIPDNMLEGMTEDSIESAKDELETQKRRAIVQINLANQISDLEDIIIPDPDDVSYCLVSKLEQAKQDALSVFGRINIPEEMLEGKTEESIKAALEKLDELKREARKKIEDAKSVEEVKAVTIPEGEDVAYLLKDKDEKPSVDEKLEQAKKDKVSQIEGIQLSGKDTEGMTGESVKAAADKLDELKKAAIDAVNAAKTVDEVNSVKVPSAEDVADMLKPAEETPSVDEKLEQAKKAKTDQIEGIQLSEKDTEGMTEESVKKASVKLEELKKAAIAQVDAAKTVEEVDAVKVPSAEDVLQYLVKDDNAGDQQQTEDPKDPGENPSDDDQQPSVDHEKDAAGSKDTAGPQHMKETPSTGDPSSFMGFVYGAVASLGLALKKRRKF